MADVKRGLYIPPELAEDTNISAVLKLVYAVYLEHADDEGLSEVCSREIGERLGMLGNSVLYSRRMLEALGYIDPVFRKEKVWCLKYLEVRNA